MIRYMRGNHSNRVPSHHVAVDTETVPWSPPGKSGESHHRLLLGCATGWRYRSGVSSKPANLDFTAREEWWEWVYRRAQKGTRLWVWAHNAPFDMTVLGLWDEIESGRLKIKTPVGSSDRTGDAKDRSASVGPSLITSPFCFMCDCTDDSGRSYRFIDTTNFAPLALKKIGPMMGMQKLDMPGELGEDTDWSIYCRRDCDILHALVDRICGFVRKFDLGNMAVTLGGQSMAHYRHSHLAEEIAVGPDDTIRPLEREGYYGARTECHYRGVVGERGMECSHPTSGVMFSPPITYSDGIYRLDVNQCYPHVMGRNRYPIKLFRRLHNPSIRDLKNALYQAEGVAEVRINTLLEPYQQRVGGKTSWRVGRFSTVLCGPELLRALDSGHVESVREAQVYISGPIFSTWSAQVEGWRRDARRDGDLVHQALLKRMANSLHGKFGQSGRGWQTVPGVIPAQPWGMYFRHDMGTGKTIQCRGVGNVEQVASEEPDAAGASPIIAACVTAHARELVRAAVLVAGVREVYYQDADSIHVSSDGFSRLDSAGWIHPDEPGRFKVEGTVRTAEYRGRKHYRFGEEEVIPGRAHSGKIDERGLWKQDEWVRLDSLLSSGKPDSPITIEREIGPVTPDPAESHAADGWIVYRQGE